MRNDILDTYLLGLGLRENLAGTIMVREAVRLWKPGARITKDIYPEVAKRCGSTTGRVERAMRHAIETGFDRADPAFIGEVFGGTIDPDRGKPCNAEFVARLARLMHYED